MTLIRFLTSCVLASVYITVVAVVVDSVVDGELWRAALWAIWRIDMAIIGCMAFIAFAAWAIKRVTN